MSDPTQFIPAAPGRHYAAFPRSAMAGDLDMFEIMAWMSKDDCLFPMVFCGGVLRNAAIIDGYSGVFIKTNDTASGFSQAHKSAGFINDRFHASGPVDVPSLRYGEAHDEHN